MGIVRNCAHMNSFILRTGLWSRSDHELWFVFLWNPSLKQLSVKTPSCSMPSVGTSFVNNTLLFLLNTLVLTSENMLCKSSLSPLGELVEARVVTGIAANGTDFLESMVSRLSKGHFDLHFLDLNWKSPASLRLDMGAFAQKFFVFVKIPWIFFAIVRVNIFNFGSSQRLRHIYAHNLRYTSFGTRKVKVTSFSLKRIFQNLRKNASQSRYSIDYAENARV